MGSQEHNMVVLRQIIKHIPKKLIERLKHQHKIQALKEKELETSPLIRLAAVQMQFDFGDI